MGVVVLIGIKVGIGITKIATRIYKVKKSTYRIKQNKINCSLLKVFEKILKHILKPVSVSSANSQKASACLTYNM